MMDSALPPPTVSFTIPSHHDATVLSCRVYHPDSLSVAAPPPPLLHRRGATASPWRGQVAVFAHPYGPLGGSADDRVVDVVVSALLRKGYVVGTFNFRGAGDSGGKTSWTARGEKNDYISVAAFMVYYAHHLDPPDSSSAGDKTTTTPPAFIMGGYSYGAMVTTLLPPLGDLLRPFARPELGSAAAEIRLRAEHLAELENSVLARAAAAAAAASGGAAPPRSSGIRVGGMEQAGDVRGSLEGRRPFIAGAERIRRSLDRVGRMRRGRDGGEARRGAEAGEAGRVGGGGEGPQEEGHRRLEDLEIVVPRVAYLLVSPLQGVITHLATMSFPLPSLPKLRSPFSSHHRHHHHRSNSDNDKTTKKSSENHPPDNPDPALAQGQDPKSDTAPEELKLTRNPTVAVFGDRDGFVPVSKLRGWARRLQGAPGSRFHGVEVSTAGHFWVEEGVLDKLVGVVGGFSAGLLEERGDD